jgi:hypothetical protein
MNDTLQRVNSLLKSFNKSFNISADVQKEDDGTETVVGLKIDAVNDDGTEFMSDLFDLFAQIISASDSDYELVYNKDHGGLCIAKKKIAVDYEIQD